MKLRSLTYLTDLGEGNGSEAESRLDRFFDCAAKICEEEGVALRTVRVALSPVNVRRQGAPRVAAALVQWWSDLCRRKGIRWFCVPFDTRGQDMREVNQAALEIGRRYKNAFINYIIADDHGIRREAALYAAKLIKSISRLENTGYDNFRVGASFHCRPNGPFFPFTYHEGQTGFSVAVEIVPLFIEVLRRRGDTPIERVRENLVERVAPALQRVERLAQRVAEGAGVVYYGIDASLAPFPDNDDGSVARIIELLGADGFGCYGTTFLTAYLTDVLKDIVARSGVRQVGFNGVMFSLLEDTRLGASNLTKGFSIDSLIAFSTMCGCGVDMVPLPGDVFEEEIASIMLDVAAVAARLGKPLGVRVLPIPGKQAFEMTEFCYDFLHNTRILKVNDRACSRALLSADAPFRFVRQPKDSP